MTPDVSSRRPRPGSHGGRASGTTVLSGGGEVVSSGGFAGATAISGGTLEVVSGGSAGAVLFGTLQAPENRERLASAPQGCGREPFCALVGAAPPAARWSAAPTLRTGPQRQASPNGVLMPMVYSGLAQFVGRSSGSGPAQRRRLPGGDRAPLR
jgi:autotransporter passenger strand-loop-strand repeat protein